LIAFTAYTDVANKNQASCEIYIMGVDRTNLQRLTTIAIAIINPDGENKYLQSPESYSTRIALPQAVEEK